MASEYDWTRFAKQVFIRTDIESAFRYFATPNGLEQWFIAHADYTAPDGSRRPADALIQPGDRYHWRWHQKLEAHGEVLEVVDNQRVQFTFGDKAPGSDEKIIVTVTFEDRDGETLIELTQHNMGDTPADHVGWHLSCNLGWSFFMTNLKALTEHGVDLREKSPDRAYTERAITH